MAKRTKAPTGAAVRRFLTEPKKAREPKAGKKKKAATPTETASAMASTAADSTCNSTTEPVESPAMEGSVSHEADNAAEQPATDMVSVAEPETPAQPDTPAQKDNRQMVIKLTPSTATRKDDRLVIMTIEGRKGSVQFLKTLFGDNVPGPLELTGDSIAEAKVSEPKVKETPAERKARLATLPKLTPAQKLAKAEEKVAALRAKLAAAQAAPATA